MRGINVSAALDSLWEVDSPGVSCGCIPVSWPIPIPGLVERQNGGSKSREVTKSDRMGVDSCAGAAGRLSPEYGDGEAGLEGSSNDGVAGYEGIPLKGRTKGFRISTC